MFCLILISLTLTVTIFPTQAGSLSVSVSTDKETYDLGLRERISITGNVTWNGEPVSDALVALQVNNPKGDIYIVRTLTTGENPQTLSALEITEFIPCDSQGNPVSTVEKGGTIGFKITIKNNAATSYHYIAVINLYYQNQIPFLALIAINDTINPQTTTTTTVWPIVIPDNAILGTTTAYVSVLTDLPAKTGFPYCPEKSTSFNIAYSSSIYQTQPQNGTFNLAIKLASMQAWLGTYSIRTVVFYSYAIATAQSTYEVTLVGDFNGDLKINMRDISRVAKAFGSVPGSPYWDPILDLNGDNKIDMRDISRIAYAFGVEAKDP